MLQYDGVRLRCARADEKDFLWRAIYIDKEWKPLDAPYFALEHQSKFKFSRHLFKRLCQGKTALVIEYQDQVVGYLAYYFEDPKAHWLEVGITLFYRQYWNKKIGRKALVLWISHLFNTSSITRVGLTTWSGNPMMMKCATAIGMKLEGRFRRVRFFNNHYYDSVHYGVLREEWQGVRNKTSFLPVN